MITAHIQNFNLPIIKSACAFQAYLGFRELGAHINLVDDGALLEDAERENISVGGVGFVRARLRKLGISYDYLDYPEELTPFLGRKVWISTINQVAADLPRVFVKPRHWQKFFTGRVINSTKDLIGTGVQGGDYEVYCSEVVDMRAEFRVYVRYGKILGLKQYAGDYKLRPDYELIEKAIAAYQHPLKAYGIDFCLTADNRTLLIEVNDGYALGNYGLDNIQYAKFLYTRWADLTGGKDWYDF